MSRAQIYTKLGDDDSSYVTTVVPCLSGPRSRSHIFPRAERGPVAYQAYATTPQSDNPQALAYLNRVFDLLYLLARHAASDQDEPISHGDPYEVGQSDAVLEARGDAHD